VLKWIIHDWEDDESTAILRTIRRTGGTVLVIERLLGAPNEDPVAKLSDINMLVGAGGRERTLEEFATLFEAAGYRLAGSTSTASGTHLLEGVPG
jgi:O-methyltransferase domain